MEEATHRQPQPVPLIAALAGALVLLIAAPVARADDDRQLTPEQKRAGDLFELADTHYAAGRYEEAAKYFLEGYKLAPHPEFLYSLGNTYERMGEYQKAADYLKRYVKSPQAEDIVSVKERIKRLEAAAEAERRERLETDDSDLPEGDDDADADDLEDDDDSAAVVDDGGSSSRAHYYWFAGAGLGLAGAATFGLLARSAATAASGSCDAAGLCEEAARAELDREKRFALLADASLVAGVAAAVVGAVVLIRNRSDKPSSSEQAALRLEPVLTPHGGGVGLAGSF